MLDFEDIRDLREEWEFTLDRDAYRSKIAAYVADMAVGDVGRAELLMALSESLLMEDADPLDRAFENFKPDAAASIRERSRS